MNEIYPAALKSGDTIGIIAPSSVYDVALLQPAIEFLTSKGFKVVFHPQTTLQNGQFAGTPEDKANALHDYFKDPDIKAIFCTCGGNGAIHLLDKIDYNLIEQNPKILMGFSDITALLNAISAKTGLITFHGPTLTRIDKIKPEWPEQMLALLNGSTGNIELSDSTYLKNGTVEGRLFGGNLSVLQTLIGTPYAPDLNNAILFIEDINDHLSRYDRMIGHMKQAGWLDNISGIILGEFLQSQDNAERPFGFSIEGIIQNQVTNRPILTNAPIGHGERLCTLPIGAKLSLKNKVISFKSLS